MKAKYTPGPWEAENNGQFWEIVPKNRVSAQPYRIGDVCASDPENPNSGIQEANARLIAAAPELLEALLELDEAYCRAGTNLTRSERAEDRRRLMKARAAVAKATGEAK
jgi:hypothetical protein